MTDLRETDEHGFDKYGYLPFNSPDRLAAVLVGWAGVHGDYYEGEPTTALVVARADGTEVGRLELPGRLVNELAHALHRDFAAQRALDAGAARQQRMTRLIVVARRAGIDVGELLAYALNAAAKKLYLGPARLVHGRPGSWEASNVMDWANAGGERPAGAAGRVADKLAELFRAMGEAKEDGGQVVSDALGYAALELAEGALRGARRGTVMPSGLRMLAGGSSWAAQVWNMAKPLNYEDEWEPWQ